MTRLICWTTPQIMNICSLRMYPQPIGETQSRILKALLADLAVCTHALLASTLHLALNSFCYKHKLFQTIYHLGSSHLQHKVLTAMKWPLLRAGDLEVPWHVTEWLTGNLKVITSLFQACPKCNLKTSLAPFFFKTWKTGWHLWIGTSWGCQNKTLSNVFRRIWCAFRWCWTKQRKIYFCLHYVIISQKDFKEFGYETTVLNQPSHVSSFKNIFSIKYRCMPWKHIGGIGL